MKAILTCLAMSLASTVLASDSMPFVNPGSLIPIDSSQAELSLFINYPGKLSNQCGVKLVTKDNYLDPEISKEIVMSTGDQRIDRSNESQGLLFDFSNLVLKNQLYGLIVTLKTRTAPNFGTAFGGAELSIVSVPCKL